MVMHIDDIPEQERVHGDMSAVRQVLGSTVRSAGIGCSRWRVPGGARSAPVHLHADEEEIFFVLAGEGLSWQDGRAHPVRTGDAIVYRAGEMAHTIFGGPIDVLAFGEGSQSSLTWLPRANVMWAGPRWLPLDGAHPLDAEAAAGPLERPEPEPDAARPANIAALSEVEPRTIRRGRTDIVRHDLATAAGARRSGLQHAEIAPGAEGHPPHCHSAEEELFYVLEGAGTLRLGEAEHPVRAGSIVSRPAGTGVAHSFVAGPQGLRLLAYGQRDPRDAIFYPRSSKIRLRGLGGLTFRVEPLGYWDGEE